MFIKMTRLFLLLLALTYINCDENCPNCALPNIDFTKPEVSEAIENQIFTVLWNKTIEISENGRKLENILKTMHKSENLKLKVTALLATQWIHAYLPKIALKPNLCAFAEIINSTTKFENTEDCPHLTEALDSVLESMKEGTGLALSLGITISKCVDHEKQVLEAASNVICHADGKVYNIHEIFEQEGEEYPSEFKNVVLDLYSSDSLKDNILAIFSVTALSKHFTLLEREFDKRLKYLAFLVHTFAITGRTSGPGGSSIFDEKFCEKFIKMVIDIKNNANTESERVIKLAKNRAGCL